MTNELRGHGGGDIGMMHYLYEMVMDNLDASNTSLKGSIQSHLMAFGSERSRLEKGKLIKF